MSTVCAPYTGNIMSSVVVACTRTFRPFMSSTLRTSFLEYIERKPRVASAITWAPCTVNALDGLGHLGTCQRLLEMVLGSEQEVERHHPGLRRKRCSVGRG